MSTTPDLPPVDEAKAARIIEAIAALSIRDYAPSIAEVAEKAGLGMHSTKTALWRLRAEGRVTWQFGRPRTLRVIS